MNKIPYALILGTIIVLSIFSVFFSFSNISNIDERLNKVTDISVPVMAETNKMINLLWKNNMLIEDYLNEKDTEELAGIKNEHVQGNEDFLVSLKELGTSVTDEDFKDNLEKIKEQHFNYMEHSGELMRIHLESIKENIEPDQDKVNELENLIEFDIKRAIVEIEEINERAYQLSVNLDDEIYFQLKYLKYIIVISLIVIFLLITILIVYNYSQNKRWRDRIVRNWDKIVKIDKEIKNDEPSKKNLQLSNAIEVLNRDIWNAKHNKSIDDGLRETLDFDEKQIYDYITAQSQIGKNVSYKDVKNHFSITFPTVQKRIKSMEEKNAVKIIKSGRNKFVSLIK
jgi:hypothetical protein